MSAPPDHQELHPVAGADATIARVQAALAELQALRSADPAATRANDAIRLTAHTLEFLWLRALAAGAATERR